ncbi:MAG TPA: hypothetical protein VFF67_05640 [Thermoplasmata archaeon]|nr:hypothetical protein [Thermoplasmata archaeon]
MHPLLWIAPAAVVLLLAVSSVSFLPRAVAASAPMGAVTATPSVGPLTAATPGLRHAPTVTPATSLPISSPEAARQQLSVHVDPNSFRGPHPNAWGSGGIPPGAPVPNGAELPSVGAASRSAAAATHLNQGNTGCWSLGPSPGTGSQYLPECYGHDEPNVDFYSNLPGSGGNVTWNVTLPVDRNATANQSSLYVAIWFGMTLHDPFAWMDQCFLELQFYPDQTWTNGPGQANPALTVNGAWVAAAVAWQIEASTGFEDPCYYAPLYVHNATVGAPRGAFLNMTQGDRITVSMTGWASSPYGENLTIRDLTSGLWSNLTLYNAVQGYPLNPAFTTNSYENGLQWTPGGEFPVSFAFEIGHAASTFPQNNSYGGCSPGLPPPTPQNPSAPCPSYDPGSWVNDTLRPWHIDRPVFFNQVSQQIPTQVGFGQDLGGIGYTDFGPGWTGCLGREGSAWCSYPWYTFSCVQQTFYFGATDYPGGLNDFGKYRQFTTLPTADAAGWGYYAPTNYSIPTCGAASYAATVGTGAGGWVNFLSTPVVGTTTFTGLGPGVYSLHGIGLGPDSFEHWTTTGAVTVWDPQGAYTVLTVSGNGTVTAVFGTTPPLTDVTFSSAVTTAQFGVAPSYQFGTLGPSGRADLATLPVGGSIPLAPGIYAIEAYPPSGYNFSSWSSNSSAAVVASWGYPVSDLVVAGGSSSVTVTAAFVASTSMASVTIYVVGNGTVTFNGTPVPAYQPNAGYLGGLGVRVGSYPLLSVPGPNWTFANVYYGSNAVMTNFTPDTWVNVEDASAFLEVVFVALPTAPVNVTFADFGAADGEIALNGIQLLGNGAVVPLETGAYTVVAASNATYQFLLWSVNNSSALWVTPYYLGVATLFVNASGTLTATYAPGTLLNLTFGLTPAIAGGVATKVQFNFATTYTSGTTNTTLTSGYYSFAPVAPPGWFVVNEYTTGNAFLSGAGEVYVYGPVGGTLNVTFAQLPSAPWPVTFVAEPLGTLSATINGTAVTSGGTVWLNPGTYALDALTATANASFFDWASVGNVAVLDARNGTTMITVVGGGTVEAVGATFGASATVAAPNPVDIGNTTNVSTTIRGTTGAAVGWYGLPAGCTAGNVTSFACTPMAAGLYTVGATVTVPSGETARAAPTEISVVVGPTISIFSASPSSLTVNTPLRFSATEAGGTGPFGWAYSGLPMGCTTVNGATLSCTPTGAGSSVVTVRVTDAFGHSATATTTVVVNPTPALTSFTVTPAAVTVGIPANFSLVVSGGTAPFTFGFASSAGLGVPCGLPTPAAGATRFTCTPSTAGTYVVNGTAVDNSGVSVRGQVTLTVNPAPVITSFTASQTSFPLGTSTTFTVVASLGTGTLAYAYAQLPPGCTGIDAAQFTCKPAQVGTYNVTVTVKDVFGVAATAGTTLTIGKASTPPGPTPSGGFSNLDYGIIALVAALVVIGVVAAAWTRRKRPTSPEAWDPGSGGAPPAGGAPPPGAS